MRRFACTTVAATTALALLGSGGVAFADEIDADGDGVVPLGDKDWLVGSVCVGSTATRQIPVYVNRSQNGSNAFANSALLNVTAALTAGTVAVTVDAGPKTITLPSDWLDKATGTVSSTQNFAVSYTAPSAPGDFSRTVTFSATGKDATGSTANLTRTDTMVVSGKATSCDTTAPTTTVSATVPGGDGAVSYTAGSWTNKDVTVSMSRSESGTTYYTTDGTTPTTTSAVYSAPFTISSQAAHQVKYFTKDTAGNSESVQTFAVNIDKTAPEISGTDVENTVWRNTALSASFTATDELSGLADADKAFTLTATDESRDADTPTSVSKTITDAAGNPAVRTLTAKIDKTAPIIVGGDVNNTAWRTGSLSQDFTATDPLSGLAEADRAFTLTAADESRDASTPTTASKTITDAAGNPAVRTLSAKIDKTAPIIVGGDVNDTTWRNTPLTKDFTASDRLSGLATDADAEFSLTASSESANATTPTTVTKTVTDAVGHSTTRTLSARIDKTAPVITDSGALSEPNAAGWYKTAVTNRFERTDALSGLADGQNANNDVATGSNEGTDVRVSSDTVSDKAGNSAAAKTSAAFKIDLTKPTNVITGVTDGATYKLGEVPAATCDTTDSLSGVAAKASLTAPAGGVGTKTVTCSGGSDVAGNSADSVSVSYKVVYTTSSILQPLNADGSSKVKLGSTVPVKIKLEGAAAGFSGAVINVGNSKVTSTVTGEVLETFEVVTPHTGTQMRYDATSDQYIFNLSTKNLTVGTWQITLTLDDGTTRTVMYSIVK